MTNHNVFLYEGTEGFRAYGVRFPSGNVILEWDSESGPDDSDKIDGVHHSRYESWDDFRTVCKGDVTGISPVGGIND